MFDRITLPGGLRIIGEKIPHFRSVSVGLWLGAGSQYETPSQAGISHFIEHMVFKGTQKRTARDIAEEMDAVGGQLNAFTSKECTCFYAKVVDEHLPLAMDVIADLVTAPLFDPAEMEKEKGVVLEEISMSEDTPEDVVGELIMLAQYGDQPIARPILGTAASVAAFSREDVLAYYNAMYRPENAVLALAGNYDWNKVLALTEKYLGTWDANGYSKPIVHTHAVDPTVLRREKDIEQVHICLGYPGVCHNDKRNFELALMNSVLGGSMSSRLFQRIREESGMAYSVYSYPGAYADTGILTVYAGTSPENAATVGEMLKEEVQKMAQHGLTQREFAMGREQLKASYILGLESTSSRMQSMGRRLLLLNETRTETDVIDRVNALTLESVNALAKELLSAPYSVALVGKAVEGLQL